MVQKALQAWQDLALGCAICEPGSAAKLKTGDWRSMAPQLDEEKCIKCALCEMYCPEFCISQQEDEFYRSDLDYCKGCGICAHECPKDAITMIVEVK